MFTTENGSESGADEAERNRMAGAAEKRAGGNQEEGQWGHEISKGGNLR